MQNQVPIIAADGNNKAWNKINYLLGGTLAIVLEEINNKLEKYDKTKVWIGKFY